MNLYFQTKLYQLPSSDAIKTYEMLLSIVTSHYNDGHLSVSAGTIRAAIFNCLLKLRADILTRVGFPRKCGRYFYSPYILCDTGWVGILMVNDNGIEDRFEHELTWINREMQFMIHQCGSSHMKSPFTYEVFLFSVLPLLSCYRYLYSSPLFAELLTRWRNGSAWPVHLSL